MKKLVILTLILAAGLTAYPQSSSRSKESKSRSSSNVSKSSNSKSKSSASRSSSSSKPKATQSRSSSSASRAKATQSRSSNSSRPKATQSKSSSSSSSRSKATQPKSGNSSRSQAVRSSSGNSSRSQAARSSSSSNRNAAQKAKSSRSTDAYKSSANRSSSASRSSSVRGSSNSASRSTAVRSQSNVASRSSDAKSAQRLKGTSSNSFNRENRQGSKVYVKRDGREFRHQNDEIFAKRRYKVDYRNPSDLRRSNDFRRVYRDYERWHNHRYRRTNVVYHYHINPPLSLEIRRMRYPYRRPIHIDLCWTPWLHNQFMYYYPMHTNWNNDYGHYIETVSTYDAVSYVGSVKRIYGKVEEVYYSEQDRTYTLYFGAPFPYHDFSVVVPRGVAKDITWSPSWYFENEFVWIVGLIDVFEGKPEIVVHDEDQIKRY